MHIYIFMYVYVYAYIYINTHIIIFVLRQLAVVTIETETLCSLDSEDAYISRLCYLAVLNISRLCSLDSEDAYRATGPSRRPVPNRSTKTLKDRPPIGNGR